MEATAGSYALLGAKPAHEATVVTKLREAGAIILGKATLTEWANYRWMNAATGWCARGGQCTGPFYPKMKASGSSTGSGVSTALGLTFASLGTEVRYRCPRLESYVSFLIVLDGRQHLQSCRKGELGWSQAHHWSRFARWSHSSFQPSRYCRFLHSVCKRRCNCLVRHSREK